MITMHPVLLNGRTTWDQSFFPLDEFEERILAVRELMVEQQIDALLVLGDAGNYANLCYLTHFIPMRVGPWALAIIPATDEPTLLSQGGDRNLPAMKKTTWFSDFRCFGRISEGVKPVLLEKGLETARLGIVGSNDVLPHYSNVQLLNALSDFEITEADQLMNTIRSKLRPREASAIIHAAAIARLAKQRMHEVFSENKSVRNAAFQGELAARKLGAHDVRILISSGSGRMLWPLGGFSPIDADRFIAYVAVDFQGYWADAAVAIPEPDSSAANKAKSALGIMTKACKGGAVASTVAEKAVRELGNELGPAALEIGLGNGIGLSLEQSPVVKLDSQDRLIDGNIMSLRVYVPDGETAIFTSDLVIVAEGGGQSI